VKLQPCEKCLKFNFIALSNTFFTPKVKGCKETVKFLAVFNHAAQCALSSPFSLLPPVRSCRFNVLAFQCFNVVFASPTQLAAPKPAAKAVQPSPGQSNRIQPNPTTPLPPGKEIGKETVKFLAILITRPSAPFPPRFLC